MSGKREHWRRWVARRYSPGRGARRREWLRAWKFWKQKEPPRWRVISRMLWKLLEPKWEG